MSKSFVICPQIEVEINLGKCFTTLSSVSILTLRVEFLTITIDT